jgi:hypothetical protein
MGLRSVRCGSDRVLCGPEGCGVAQRVRCGSDRVRCGSDCSASACFSAGPSSNFGWAPLEEALYRADAIRILKSGTLRVVYLNIVCLLD